MKRGKTHRKRQRTASPFATDYVLEDIAGRVWNVGIRRRDVVGVNSQVIREYGGHAPRMRKVVR